MLLAPFYNAAVRVRPKSPVLVVGQGFRAIIDCIFICQVGQIIELTRIRVCRMIFWDHSTSSRQLNYHCGWHYNNLLALVAGLFNLAKALLIFLTV